MNERAKRAMQGGSEPTYDRRVTAGHVPTRVPPFEVCELSAPSDETFAEVGSYTVRIFNDRHSCREGYEHIQYQIDGGAWKSLDPGADPVCVRKEADGPDRVIELWCNEECDLFERGPASSAEPPRRPSDSPGPLAPRVTLTLTKKGGS